MNLHQTAHCLVSLVVWSGPHIGCDMLRHPLFTRNCLGDSARSWPSDCPPLRKGPSGRSASPFFRNELRKIENLMSQTFEHSESGWEELIDELPPTAAWTEVDWSCTIVQGLFCFYSVCLDLVNRMSPWCRARPRNLFLQLYCGDYRCPSVAARMSCQLALSVLNASWWKGVHGETEQCRTLRFRNSSRCPPVAQPASCARLFHGELFREKGSKTFSMNSFKQWLGRQVFEFGLLHLTPPANTFLT